MKAILAIIWMSLLKLVHHVTESQAIILTVVRFEYILTQSFNALVIIKIL